jgi:hypothetical protein
MRKAGGHPYSPRGRTQLPNLKRVCFLPKGGEFPVFYAESSEFCRNGKRSTARTLRVFQFLTGRREVDVLKSELQKANLLQGLVDSSSLVS